jgi:hypothetical protein
MSRHIGAGTTRMRLVGTASAGRLSWGNEKSPGTRKTLGWFGGARSKWQNCEKS